ncbi:MAG: hypothetical protein ACE5KV_06600 [Thermoplasmata archaeon]
MLYEELLEVLRETNSEREDPVEDKVLEEILALVIKNPLEEDRKRCQSQIEVILKQRSKGGRK